MRKERRIRLVGGLVAVAVVGGRGSFVVAKAGCDRPGQAHALVCSSTRKNGGLTILKAGLMVMNGIEFFKSLETTEP
jgi:hypothetical protein